MQSLQSDREADSVFHVAMESPTFATLAEWDENAGKRERRMTLHGHMVFVAAKNSNLSGGTFQTADNWKRQHSLISGSLSGLASLIFLRRNEILVFYFKIN